MRILCLKEEFTVCQPVAFTPALLQADCTFFARTRDEISLVCPTAHAPEHTLQREDGFRCFYLDGVLDFSLVGILANIAGLLAEKGISIFAISTYNTDYILVKQSHLVQALQILSQNGYDVQYCPITQQR